MLGGLNFPFAFCFHRLEVGRQGTAIPHRHPPHPLPQAFCCTLSCIREHSSTVKHAGTYARSSPRRGSWGSSRTGRWRSTRRGQSRRWRTPRWPWPRWLRGLRVPGRSAWPVDVRTPRMRVTTQSVDSQNVQWGLEGGSEWGDPTNKTGHGGGKENEQIGLRPSSEPRWAQLFECKLTSLLSIIICSMFITQSQVLAKCIKCLATHAIWPKPLCSTAVVSTRSLFTLPKTHLHSSLHDHFTSP